MEKQSNGNSMMVKAMFYWETLGPIIPAESTLLHTIYLRIIENLFSVTVFYDYIGIVHQNIVT